MRWGYVIQRVDNENPIVRLYSDTFRLNHSFHLTTTLGTSDIATITLTSQSDPSVTASAKLITYAAITTYLPMVKK